MNETSDPISPLKVRLEKLEEDVKRPKPKDIWDKLATVSSLFSGVLIAGLALYATTVYNQRQLEANTIQKERELATLELQTVETFFEHLSSGDRGQQRSALDAIASLAGPQFATKLAVNFGGRAGRGFLNDLLASSNDPNVKRAAAEGLLEIKQRISSSLDLELAHRLSLLNDLIVNSEINDRVMSEVQNVFEETPPADQEYMIGGSRFLLVEYASKNLSTLFQELQDAVQNERANQIEAAVAASSRLKAMIVSTPTREVGLTGSIIGDVPDFSGEQFKTIMTEIIPSFQYWLDYEAGRE